MKIQPIQPAIPAGPIDRPVWWTNGKTNVLSAGKPAGFWRGYTEPPKSDFFSTFLYA